MLRTHIQRYTFHDDRLLLLDAPQSHSGYSASSHGGDEAHHQSKKAKRAKRAFTAQLFCLVSYDSRCETKTCHARCICNITALRRYAAAAEHDKSIAWQLNAKHQVANRKLSCTDFVAWTLNFAIELNPPITLGPTDISGSRGIEASFKLTEAGLQKLCAVSNVSNAHLSGLDQIVCVRLGESVAKHCCNPPYPKDFVTASSVAQRLHFIIPEAEQTVLDDPNLHVSSSSREERIGYDEMLAALEISTHLRCPSALREVRSPMGVAWLGLVCWPKVLFILGSRLQSMHGDIMISDLKFLAFKFRCLAFKCR